MLDAPDESVPELTDRRPDVVMARCGPEFEVERMFSLKTGAWLDGLHRALDEAVAAAYGWPANISDDDVLARLLTLNHARAGR